MSSHFSPRFRRETAVLVGMVAGALMVGCETSAPPPPRALTITAQEGQSQAQQDRDNVECQSMAAAQANSSESWAQIFTACMGGRGYRVQ